MCSVFRRPPLGLQGSVCAVVFQWHSSSNLLGDRDKEQPVRGPACLRIMGTRVLRGPVRITKEMRHAHRCKCVRYGACMHLHVRLCTCVRAEEKVGYVDSTPKRGPLSSQTQPRRTLISAPEWLGWWQLQQLTARLGHVASDKHHRRSRGRQQRKVKLSWKLNAPQKHNAICITAVDTEPGASVFLSGFISSPSCIGALSCHWPLLK